MDPVTEAIQQFSVDFRDFLDDPQARILRVVVEAKNVGTLGKALRGEEWNPENQSPFLVFDTAYTIDRDTFESMSRTVRQHYDILKESFAEDGQELPEFDLQFSTDEPPLHSFGRHLRRFTECTAGVLKTPLICWLPTDVKERKQWTDYVIKLFQMGADSDFRFVIADQEGEHLAKPLLSVKNAAMTIRFDIDEAGLNDWMMGMLAAPSAGRAPGTLPGAAAPDVVPPPRPGPPPPTDEEIKAAAEAAGLPPMLTPREGEELRGLVMTAAQGAAKNDPEIAITKQRDACKLCERAGVKLEQSLMVLVLANYLLQFKSEKLAEEHYIQAARLAEEAEAPAQEAQATMALGYLQLKNNQFETAAALYEKAGGIALTGEANLLYLESMRMAGTCHLKLKREKDAARCWDAAVKQGREATPDEIANSSFLDVAGELIKLLEKHGLKDQAQSVRDIVTEVGEKAQV